jgi:hypothetical protein
MIFFLPFKVIGFQLSKIAKSWICVQLSTYPDGFSRTSHALMEKLQTTLQVEKLAQKERVMP